MTEREREAADYREHIREVEALKVISTELLHSAKTYALMSHIV